jgi:hypothetical protein
MDSQRNIYLIRSKKAAIVLIVSLLICFVSIELGKVQAISDFSFRLHEMLYLPINIGIFLIPLEVVFVLYCFIRWVIELRKDANSKSKLNILLNLTAFLCLSLYVFYFIYMSYGVSTSGVYENLSKKNQENKYYIVVNNIRLSCTRNEYNLMNSGRKYLMSYEWNKLSPETGTLTYIEEVK